MHEEKASSCKAIGYICYLLVSSNVFILNIMSTYMVFRLKQVLQESVDVMLLSLRDLTHIRR